MKGSRAEATVFLGGGRITSALIAGLRSSGYEQPIVVHDRDAQKLGHLKRQYSVTIEHDLRRAVDHRTPRTAAAHALADGILVCRKSKMALDELLREAATPGGTAATVMAAMSSAGYERAVEKGLKAGMARARKNAGLR